MSIIIFLAILLILVIAHEFGHFITAKKSGIRVDEFAFGFPPKLFSKKFGETVYVINALPIGGYVKIYGEDPTQIKKEDAERSFPHKKRIIQSAVVLAGIVANLIVAWILFSIILMIGMRTTVGANYFGEIKNVDVTITQILEGSPAMMAGLMTGDNIKELKNISTGEIVKANKTDDVTNFIGGSNEKEITITYERKNVSKELTITPKLGVTESGKPAIGIAMEESGILKLPVHLALAEGAIKTFDYTIFTTVGIYDFISKAIVGNGNFKEVSGPIGIVGAVGDAARLGFVNVLFFAAIISINLAVINLIPFPALDGGRFLFIIIEGIIRKPLPVKFTNSINLIGFGLLMLLMIIVTYHDIVKLF